jgi:hypothetical protein
VLLPSNNRPFLLVKMLGNIIAKSAPLPCPFELLTPRPVRVTALRQLASVPPQHHLLLPVSAPFLYIPCFCAVYVVPLQHPPLLISLCSPEPLPPSLHLPPLQGVHGSGACALRRAKGGGCARCGSAQVLSVHRAPGPPPTPSERVCPSP